MNFCFNIDMLIKAISENMLKMAEEKTKEIPCDVEEIRSDYSNYDRAVRRLERIEDVEDRRNGYENLRDEICRRYHPNTFSEEVFYLADEFSRPYNRFLTYDSPPYISALPEDATSSRLQRHFQAFIFILYTDIQRRLLMMPEKNDNDNKQNEEDMIKSMEEARKKGITGYVAHSMDEHYEREEQRKKRKQEERIRKLEIEKDEMAKQLKTLETKITIVAGTFGAIGQAASALSSNITTPPQSRNNNGTGISNTIIQNTTAGEEESIEVTPLPSFGLSSKKQAHWGTVYTRLVGKGWLKKSEVTKLEFVYIMCAVGDKRFKQIKWHGATNALADIVRRKLQVDGVDRWEIAPLVFLDKNGKPLPPSFETTKSPCQNTQKVIDGIFDE